MAIGQLWSKLSGTLSTFFQFGGPSAPGIQQGTSNSLESRNAANNAYVNHRGLDPVIAADFATKGYVDGAAGVGGAVREIRYAIAFGGGASQSSVTSIPASAQVISAEVSVTVAWSAGTTITVGQSGALASFMATTDSVAQTTGLYQVMQDTTSTVGAGVVVTTIAGAPSAGTGFIIVRYCLPLA